MDLLGKIRLILKIQYLMYIFHHDLLPSKMGYIL